MTGITDDDIRSLVAIKSADAPVVSCYLDVDGSRYVRAADYERSLDAMLRRARVKVGADEGALADLARIEERVADGFDRSGVRGVAIFACAPIGLFEVVELPVSVRNEITLNHTPTVGQLEVVVQQAEKLAVLAADKQHARVFVFRLGDLVEHTEVTDEIGRDYDTLGEHDRGGPDHHREALEQQHLRHAAAILWSVFQTEGFDHLVIAAPDQLASDLERGLHPYLRDRLHGRLDLLPSASTAEVRAAAIEAQRAIERDREAALVDELRDAVASNGRGVAGIAAVVQALAERRVDRLVVSDGYSIEGWVCTSCGRLATVGRDCPACGQEMQTVDDLVEGAVEEALAQSCRVDVCTGNADLDVLGRVGALLRF